MLVQAKYRTGQDAARILSRVGESEDLRGAELRVFLDEAQPEDQKLLQVISRSLRKPSRQQQAFQLLKVAGLATGVALPPVVYGIATLYHLSGGL